MPEPGPQTRIKDDRTWAVGTDEDVAWINDGVSPGLSISASIPPIFAAYATLVFPLGLESSRDQMRPAEDRFDDALLRVLCAHTQPQPWWLGFLDTGASDVVLDDAPRVVIYSGWNYVLAQAGPREARTWRTGEGRWFTALPELMFPTDRSWLVSSLWDDAWAGVGGSAELISALLTEPELHPRSGENESLDSRYVAVEPARRHARTIEALADDRRQRWSSTSIRSAAEARPDCAYV